MRKTLSAVAALFLLVFGLHASAQQQSLMLGADTGTQPDGGIMRRVQVDSSGRLVISTTTVYADGGTSSNSSVTFSCTTRSQSVTSVGTSASSLPTALTTRWMVRVCNSAENTGTPIVKCRDDGTNPVMGIANAGEALEVGDCVSYYTTAAIRCISDTAATAVTQSECQ